MTTVPAVTQQYVRGKKEANAEITQHTQEQPGNHRKHEKNTNNIKNTGNSAGSHGARRSRIDSGVEVGTGVGAIW